MRTVLAADLGGTKCRFALVGEDLSVHAPQVVPTLDETEPFVAAMDRAFEELLSTGVDGAAAPSAIGVGVAGIVTRGERYLEGIPNLPLDEFPLREHLESKFGLPVTLLNDGRASAWGEYLRGAAKGQDPLLTLFFGTGIGIGLVVDGSPYAGARNAAGEIGHTVYRPGGRRCVCGRLGCFEGYCGGGPMTTRAAEELGPHPDGRRWTVTDLLELAATNPAAREILKDAEDAACAMVASLATLLNPGAIVLGGGVLQAWPELQEKLEASTRAWVTRAVGDELMFATSEGGSDAILWGAAMATGGLDAS